MATVHATRLRRCAGALCRTPPLGGARSCTERSGGSERANAVEDFTRDTVEWRIGSPSIEVVCRRAAHRIGTEMRSRLCLSWTMCAGLALRKFWGRFFIPPDRARRLSTQGLCWRRRCRWRRSRFHQPNKPACLANDGPRPARILAAGASDSHGSGRTETTTPPIRRSGAHHLHASRGWPSIRRPSPHTRCLPRKVSANAREPEASPFRSASARRIRSTGLS